MPAKASSVGIKVPKRRRCPTLHHASSWDMGSDSTCALTEEVKGKGDKRCQSNSESSFRRAGGWILPR
jgi:hypothetical protein